VIAVISEISEVSGRLGTVGHQTVTSQHFRTAWQSETLPHLAAQNKKKNGVYEVAWSYCADHRLYGWDLSSARADFPARTALISSQRTAFVFTTYTAPTPGVAVFSARITPQGKE